jgi:putative transposase
MKDTKERAEESMVTRKSAITIDEGQIHKHLEEMVRDTVEDTLNRMLEIEADQLCKARRYERNTNRRDTRAGHYARQLQTKAGEVKLQIP